jgi:hypothetical protein
MGSCYVVFVDSCYQHLKTGYWSLWQESSGLKKKAANRWKCGCIGDSVGGDCL